MYLKTLTTWLGQPVHTAVHALDGGGVLDATSTDAHKHKRYVGGDSQ